MASTSGMTTVLCLLGALFAAASVARSGSAGSASGRRLTDLWKGLRQGRPDAIVIVVIVGVVAACVIVID